MVCFVSGEGPEAVLEGFTLTNGTGTCVSGQGVRYGGGVFVYHASPVIRGCVIAGNSVTWNGWGTARGGGAAFLSDTGDAPLFTRNVVRHNFVEGYGGGICAEGGAPVFSNNRVFANTAEDWSWFDGGRPPHSEVYGGGFYVHDSIAVLVNDTVVENAVSGYTMYGSGIYAFGGSTKIVNSIVRSNHGGPFTPQIEGDPQVTYSDVEGGYPGQGNMGAIPSFVDPGSFDLHLLPESLCRDAGTAAAPHLPEEDFEGDPRAWGAAPDMGADEFHRHPYLAGEAHPGGTIEIRFLDLPGTAPVILGVSDVLLDPPLKTAYGLWYLQLPLLTMIGLGSIPSGGLLSLPYTFPPDTPVPLDLFLQALSGDKMTNPLHLAVR